jgi:hypothetical protein
MEMPEASLKDLIDRMYSSFLVRDFFAKVLPGGFLLGAILLAFPELQVKQEFFLELPFLGWLLLYGACFVLGFLVQALGERVGWVRAFSADETEEAFRVRMVEFKSLTIPVATQIQRERYVVVKELTGNASFSLLLGVVVVTSSIVPLRYRPWLFLCFAFTAIYSLWWFQNVHQRRQRDFEKKAIATHGVKQG